MKLNLQDMEQKELLTKTNIILPTYNIKDVQSKTRENPVWVHFGIGNIFRVFLGSIVDDLLNNGLLDRGLSCVETFDYEVVDKIYVPHDNLNINVILNSDGTRDIKLIGSLAEAVKADYCDSSQWERLKEIFISKSLQIISFTITEKGYSLTNSTGDFLPYVLSDINNGPDKCRGAMAIVTSMLFERFKNGKYPLALVSMDNCAMNGKLLKNAVCTMAKQWNKNGFVPDDFLSYIEDENIVAFDCTMIDKITPRPSTEIATDLKNLGFEDIDPIVTSKRTYIAPFVNAEKPQYLVIEDRFPNGRPELEKAYGVYLGDIDTVTKAERMKVTACLNPGHTAVGPLGVVLGYDEFAKMLHELPITLKMAQKVILEEGMKYVPDPKILSPKDFANEVFERFLNVYLGDTNLRLATDASQGLAVRFGETIKAYVEHEGSAKSLVAIPLGIASFFRYMMGIDDNLNPFVLAPDPWANEMNLSLKDITIGDSKTYHGQLKKFLENKNIFGVNLYEAGLGEKIENYFVEMISKKGATLETILKYIK